MTGMWMQAISRPDDLVMSQGWQKVFIVAALVFLAGFAIAVIRTALVHRDLLPLAFLPAGFVTSPLESMVCGMGRCWHPPAGQFNFYTAFGQSIPWHMPLLYSAFYGLLYLLAYQRTQLGALTARYLWTCYGAYVVGTYFLVIIVRHAQLWTQYGHQALWIWHGSHPLFWTFLDVSSAFMPLGIIIALHYVLRGGWRILAVFASPVGAVMGLVGPAMPYFWVANSAHEADEWWVQLSGTLSVALSIAVVALVIKLATGSPPTTIEPAQASALDVGRRVDSGGEPR